MKKVVIIGGMAAGCKTAARLRRILPDADITIVEKKHFVSYGTCGMPFYVMGDVEDFYDLTKMPFGITRDEVFFREAKDINVMTNTLVESIDEGKNEVYCKNLNDGKETTLEYDSLVIATGAQPITDAIEHPKSSRIKTFHNPTDAKSFLEFATSNPLENVAIIGGGYISIELAEAIAGLWGFDTHIFEKEPCLLPNCFCPEMSRILEKTLESNDVNVHISKQVRKIDLNEDGIPNLIFDDETRKFDYVFMCMGVKPAVSLAESIGIKTGNFGGIVADEQLRTNKDNIWAGGDCVEVTSRISGNPCYVPLGSLANRQGRVIADSIAGLETGFKGAAGAISLKVFDFITTCTGLSENMAREQGYDVGLIFANFLDRPKYHPDAKNLNAKLVYEKSSLKLLGLQLAGKGEVARYNDIFSDIAARGGTAYDLLDVEHAYTPPHAGPMNPLNEIGAMAIAQEKQNVNCHNPFMLEAFKGQVLDLREKEEVELHPLPGESVNYPLMEYRKHINEFDKEKPLLTICQRGPRAYDAACTFINEGFKDVCYLGGGVQFSKKILD